MDIRHLELLRDLRERGSLAAVAAATHRTPSALSQQLRTAQRAAGTPLVEARGRGLRLTEAGELLADGADEVGAAFADAARDITPYLAEPGHELTGVCALRTAVAERYTARGLPTEAGQIMITSGAQHAIGLILAAFTQPGDRVLVEQPTYHGALSAISTSGARAVPVSLNEQGWELDAVHAAMRQLAPSLEHHHVKQPGPGRRASGEQSHPGPDAGQAQHHAQCARGDHPSGVGHARLSAPARARIRERQRWSSPNPGSCSCCPSPAP